MNYNLNYIGESGTRRRMLIRLPRQMSHEQRLETARHELSTCINNEQRLGRLVSITATNPSSPSSFGNPRHNTN
jgi:hypothetical protein